MHATKDDYRTCKRLSVTVDEESKQKMPGTTVNVTNLIIFDEGCTVRWRTTLLFLRGFSVPGPRMSHCLTSFRCMQWNMEHETVMKMSCENSPTSIKAVVSQRSVTSRALTDVFISFAYNHSCQYNKMQNSISFNLFFDTESNSPQILQRS